MPGDQIAQLCWIDVAGFGDAGNLIFGGGEADVRVQTAGGRGDQIDRNWRTVAGIGVA